MARKKKPAEHENHERWLVSYADFITLLFAFFVVMFASSQTDKGKAKQMSESVQKALDNGQVTAAIASILGGASDDRGRGNAQMRGPGGAHKAAKEERPDSTVVELLPSMEFLSHELSQQIARGEMKISLEPRGLIISLKQAAFFPSGGETIAPATYSSIEKVASAIVKLPNPVRLEGHTDAVPIHNSRFRSNWELSTARSIEMLELLTTRYAVDRSRLAVAGYAETIPVTSNDDEAGRAQNRRVDIVILNQNGLKSEPVAAAPQPPPKKH